MFLTILFAHHKTIKALDEKIEGISRPPEELQEKAYTQKAGPSNP